MDLGDCYRILGLRTGASFADVKSSYRRLAQLYHPDINPEDRKAKDKFIALTEAYKLLLQVLPATDVVMPQSKATRQATTQQRTATTRKPSGTSPAAAEATTGVAKERVQTKPPNLAEIEQRLKWKTYEQLQRFLQERRFPQAIALAEALAERLPDDAEVRQWQAVAYQVWARALITEKQWLKARIYLKKAMKTDPHNKSLLYEVQCDFQKLEQIF
ncbi:J domain-containing protein [Calothrix sp. PCC 6303]|uniref:J domain-containing protein n=1 Tax=Calothrix sp. PCC 6303 TaxID=1170562 RepID=UPI0002A04520|nr:J domain-containing protein [Calothrix sp. PCC 6303]AFZ02302.1 heat shock protein DnaJ domain protein [Calothrix sp. PCC 6303]